MSGSNFPQTSEDYNKLTTKLEARRREYHGALLPEPKEIHIVIYAFASASRVVSNIQREGITDGEVFPMASRKTQKKFPVKTQNSRVYNVQKINELECQDRGQEE